VNELTPVNVINETSFHRAWQKAAAFIDEEGIYRVIGGPKEKNPEVVEKKKIKDTCQYIILTGKAIFQIENSEMHPKFPFGPKQLEEYCTQLTPEYVEKWRKMSSEDEHKFKYIYLDRTTYPFNQMEAMRENLAEQIKDQISSNRTQAITWRPSEDAFNDEPPCFQRIQIIYLGQDEDDMGHVDLRLEWRSRDINAWQSNIICLRRAMCRQVLLPNNCIIDRWVENIASLHCYEDRLNDLHGAAWYKRTGNQFFFE
jgi:thymidylate synthase